MTEEKRVLAFDFGASSGRAVVGTFDGRTIHMEEVHRFANDPVMVRGTMYWDVLRLFHEIKQGMTKAHLSGPVSSIGIDTWGVDFGMLDQRGNLLENPVHYRDRRTTGMVEEVFHQIPREELYGITGNQIMPINTLFQLFSLKQQRPEVLERAKTILFMPDLLNYFLSGVRSAEYSIASTSQMLDAKQKCWSKRILEALALPDCILPELIPTGTRIGTLDESLCEELGLEPAEVSPWLDTIHRVPWWPCRQSSRNFCSFPAGRGHCSVQSLLNLSSMKHRSGPISRMRAAMAARHRSSRTSSACG